MVIDEVPQRADVISIAVVLNKPVESLLGLEGHIGVGGVTQGVIKDILLNLENSTRA